MAAERDSLTERLAVANTELNRLRESLGLRNADDLLALYAERDRLRAALRKALQFIPGEPDGGRGSDFYRECLALTRAADVDELLTYRNRS